MAIRRYNVLPVAHLDANKRFEEFFQMIPTEVGDVNGAFYLQILNVVWNIIQMDKPLGKSSNLQWVYPMRPIDSKKVWVAVLSDSGSHSPKDVGKMVQIFMQSTSRRQFVKDQEKIQATITIESKHKFGIKNLLLRTPDQLLPGSSDRHHMETLVGIVHSMSIYIVPKDQYWVEHHLLGRCIVMRCSAKTSEFKTLARQEVIRTTTPMQSILAVIQNVNDLEWSMIDDFCALVHEPGIVVMQMRFETTVLVRETIPSASIAGERSGGKGAQAKRKPPIEVRTGAKKQKINNPAS